MSFYADELVRLDLGDCVEVMAELPAESVDAIVTDPPYGLEFMGKEWDRLGAGTELVAEDMDDSHPFRNGTRRVRYGGSAKTMQSWHEAWAREAFRVAKPGAHLLAFGGTRTYHRLASAIEDAGWEIRDCLVWAYASGFPKSHDVSKAIDRAAGAEREAGGTSGTQCSDFPEPCSGHAGNGRYSPTVHALPTLAATDAARQWDGWGTALKPAWEPIVMARKPLRGTVAGNVTAYGTGALNIGATRIPTTDKWNFDSATYGGTFGNGQAVTNPEGDPAGRWPANLLLTDPIFDGDTPGVVGGGTSESGIAVQRNGGGGRIFDQDGHLPLEDGGYTDSGTYSRFFLIPKAARSDREPLVRGGLEDKPAGSLNMRTDAHSVRNGMNTAARSNHHPTVKPLDLMRHLVRLVTPPGGTVLDCFLGSGTTAIAANAEGFRCIGIEREREYLDIALARMAHQPLGLGLDAYAAAEEEGE